MDSPVYRAARALGLHVHRYESVPESYSSQVAIVETAAGEKLVIKVPYTRVKLYREYHMLRCVGEAAPVPEVKAIWEGDGELAGALLLSYLEGQPASAEDVARLAAESGELLARVHTVELPGYGTYTEDGFCREADDWWELTRRWFDSYLPHAEPHVPPDLFTVAVDRFYSLLDGLPKPDGPRAVHRDFRPGNILVRDGKIIGLIDFESARGGSACSDFEKLRQFVWEPLPGSKKRFVEGYATVLPVPDLQRTASVYALSNIIGGIAWGVRRNSPEFLEYNLQLLEALFKEQLPR